MRVLLQRVSQASVTVNNEIVGAIERGLLAFVGFTEGDGSKEITYLADKLVHLRIFADEQGKMNKSLIDTGGSVLSVSQFTLYGDCCKGRRPNFMAAAKPDAALALYQQWNEELKSHGVDVQTGIFGAMMDVSLVNDGPVTLWLDSSSF